MLLAGLLARIAGSNGQLTLSGETATDTTTSGTTAIAQIFIETDGTVDLKKSTGTVQIDSATDWIIPNILSTKVAYEVRYISLTGDALSVSNGGVAENTWADLAGTSEWGYETTAFPPPKTLAGTFVLEIRNKATQVVVATSGTYDMTADEQE